MMGQHSGNQERLFYSFHLDDHVPKNHLLRDIDRFLDLSELRQHLSPFYSHTGRPSIDPELMIRMLIVGYCFGIRSERRLCEEVHLNLAYRWFCRLGLEDLVPGHSSFSKNRHGRFRHGDRMSRLFFQPPIRSGDGFFERLGQRRLHHPLADLGAGLGQCGDVLDIQFGEQGLDAIRQPAVAQEFVVGIRRGGETAGHLDPGSREAADHLAERSVLAAHPGDIAHAQ